jgi:hypothetical protein
MSYNARMIKKVFWKQCRFCGEPIEQKARGRTRTTCSDACRSKLSRHGQGKGIRAFKKAEKVVQKRRAIPFEEKSFDTRRVQPMVVISPHQSVYECLTCSQPYNVERWNGSKLKVSPFCSDKCEKYARYQWKTFAKALYRTEVYGTLQPAVRTRLHYGKLSPLCPQCHEPFAPNTTIYGTRKRGRPRKYCSDACRKAAYEQRWKITKWGRARIHRYRLCAGCGIKFDRTDGMGRRNMRFHSDACANRTRVRLRRTHPGRVPQRKRRGDRTIYKKGARKSGIRVNVGGIASGGTVEGQAQRGVVGGVEAENKERDALGQRENVMFRAA